MARPRPRLRPNDTKIYQIASPVQTHFRAATCAETDCPWYLDGFQTTVDESTPDGQARAAYIRADGVKDGTAAGRPQGSDRRYYRESRDEMGLTVFTFPPGTRGFGCQHRVPVDRPELLIVRNGTDPRNRRVHTRPEHWVEDFAGHQQMLHDIQAEG